MRKRILALLCALTLLLTAAVPTAFAATQTDQSEMLRVLSVMGVMNGDEKGNLNLTAGVTRAEFTKMAVAASAYKDMATAVSDVSPFSDVKYTHWAAGYIKTGIDAGWINGYLDGSFRPGNSVKLEEAVNICLKMLGYTDSDFSTGTYPYPQLALYQNLKMSSGVSAIRGQSLSRLDCARLIYNTLNATAKSGAVYASLLGYQVDAAGKIDYLSVMNGELDGPVIATSPSALTATLGFTPTTVYSNDTASTLAAVNQYDVVYYLAKSKTIWVYRNRVTGTYESAEPNRSNPTSVTVSGASYGFESSTAAWALSSTGTFKIGDTVTLLLGRNNAIAGVVAAGTAVGNMYGIVLATGTGTYQDAQGKNYTSAYVKVLGTDGSTYQYQVSSAASYAAGNIVRISASENGGTTVTRVSNTSGSLSGTVNSAGTKLGSYAFASNAKILDYSGQAAVSLTTDRLKDVRIASGDVAYYELNSAGEIETLILKNVTGDMFSYGVLTGLTKVGGGSYSFQVGGAAQAPFVSESVSYPVTLGTGIRIYSENGATAALYSMNSMTISSISGTVARSSTNQRWNVSDSVQVYIKRTTGGESEYYLSSLSAITDTGSYKLTGYYDQVEPEGGRLRVIIAVAK